MPSAPVFISHASSDDAFVRKLRQALEGFNIPVWVDSRNLRGGNALTPAIAEAIATAQGGTIECESTVGVGSTFTAKLPIAPPQKAVLEAVPKQKLILR